MPMPSPTDHAQRHRVEELAIAGVGNYEIMDELGSPTPGAVVRGAEPNPRGRSMGTPATINNQQNPAVPAEIAPGLTPAQTKALGCLLAGNSVMASARGANVNRETVAKWLETDVNFISAYNSLRQEMHSALRNELRYAAGRAAKTLRSLMGPKNPPIIRLRAATAILDAVGTEDLEDRPTHPDGVRAAIGHRDRFRTIGAGLKHVT